jgi:hypothetical protein
LRRGRVRGQSIYFDWFYERAAKIPVKIYDKKLKDELFKEVSWGKRIKLE